MANRRKEQNCTSAGVKLCDENFKIVKEKEAEFLFQTNRDFIINKLLDELREYREKYKK